MRVTVTASAVGPLDELAAVIDVMPWGQSNVTVKVSAMPGTARVVKVATLMTQFPNVPTRHLPHRLPPALHLHPHT